MAFLIRALVSADRQRFKKGEYDLDLTYITPRIIAMGFPASGIEGAWRNSINEVAMMLRKYHPGKYMVWNLSDRPYDYSIFEDQVMEFGFPDHHAPPLNLLFKIMLCLYSWLRADPLNVAVIHCLGGKGRTGTVIVCYFLLIGLFDNPLLGLDYFASKRSNIALGVTQPCQRDCVGYFARILQQNFVPRQVPYCLSKIVMYGVNQQQFNAFRPIIKVYDVRSYPRKRIYSTDCPEEAEKNLARWTTQEEIPNNAVVWQFPKKEMTVAGDVLVRVYHMPLGGGKKIFVFRFSFHTAFLEGGVLSLTEADLSAEKRFAGYHTNNFFMHLFFGEPVGAPPADIETQNTYIEDNCKMFQKIYTERNTVKIDSLDPKPTASSSVSSSSSSVSSSSSSSSSVSSSSSTTNGTTASHTTTTTTTTHSTAHPTTISDQTTSTAFTTTHPPNLSEQKALPSESDEGDANLTETAKIGIENSKIENLENNNTKELTGSEEEGDVAEGKEITRKEERNEGTGEEKENNERNSKSACEFDELEL